MDFSVRQSQIKALLKEYSQPRSAGNPRTVECRDAEEGYGIKHVYLYPSYVVPLTGLRKAAGAASTPACHVQPRRSRELR